MIQCEQGFQRGTLPFPGPTQCIAVARFAIRGRCFPPNGPLPLLCCLFGLTAQGEFIGILIAPGA
jgi:hypothetical protein